MEDPLAFDDITLEFDSTASPILKRRWVHSDAVDEPVGFEAYTVSSGVGSGTEHTMFADRQGSVIWVTEPATGQVVAGYEYDGYGQITQTQGTLSQPYGYTGREYDAESGLYHYRARAYDPAAGVFVQVDPIEFESGSLGLMGYVVQDPVNLTDPTGHETAGLAVITTGTSTGYLAAFVGTATFASGVAMMLNELDFGMWDIRSQAEADAIPGPPRGPNDDDDCWRAKERKRRAKEITNQLGDCELGMFATQRMVRGMAYIELGLARGEETRACFNGVWDPGHKREQVEAFRIALECSVMQVGP